MAQSAPERVRRYYIHNADTGVFLAEFAETQQALDWQERYAILHKVPVTVSDERGRVFSRVESDGTVTR